MAVICSSGIERDLIVDDPWDRVDALERELNRLTRAVPTTGGSGGGTNGGTTISIPIGGIIMWAGAIEDVPEGWALCDGDNGTPDLRNSFIVAAGDTYAVGDTGGADTNDLSHVHGPGTLNTDSDSHTHTSGTYATDSDAHTHGAGSYATDAEGDHTHTIPMASPHQHGPNTLATGTPSATTDYGVTAGGPTKGTGTHTHAVVSGVTTSAGSHAHGGATDGDGGHSHDVTGSSSSDSHSHDVTGSSASDSHDHDVDSGETASAGAVDQENRPVYYALALIMKVAG